MRRNFADTAARFANGDLVPTVSVGVTLGTDGKVGVDTLLEIADRALYRAKANGRNRVEMADDIPPVAAPDPEAAERGHDPRVGELQPAA